jgi:hypothetical protein
VQAAELAARAASAARAAASTAAIGKSSEFDGVTWNTKNRKWEAYVWRGGTTHHLDFYDIEADAARAVDDWLWENYREGPKNFDTKGNRIVRQSTDSSIYRGVTWFKRDGKWAARIKVDKKSEFLGYFDTEEEAAEAYDERAWKLDRPTNFRFDGTRNNLGRDGKVVPQVRPEIWTSKLSRQAA